MPSTYSRRSRTGAEESNGRRSQRRRRDESEEEEEGEDQSRRKRRQHESNRHSSSSKRRSRHIVEEEENEAGEEDVQTVDDDNDEGEEQDGEADGGLWGIQPLTKLKVSNTAQKAAEQVGSEEVKRKANDLVRLALFSEHRRVALKREDITKKVLDKESAKAFPVVFNRAQKVLRYTFGYEMVELRVKGIDNEQLTQTGQSQAAADQNDGEDKRSQDAKSRTYILRSVLPAKVIAKMNTPSSTLSAPVNDVNERVDGEAFDTEGVMLDWKRANSEVGSMGLLFFVLSLILLNGRSITDDQLRSYLRRMSLDPQKILPVALQPNASKDASSIGLIMEDYLTLLLKQSYLECSRTGVGPQGAMSVEAGSLIGKRVQARGRKSRTEDGEATGEEFEWRWGSRAESEITEKAVGDFVAEIYLHSDDQAEDDEEENEGNDGKEVVSREKKQEMLLKQIEHAAGSQLIS